MNLKALKEEVFEANLGLVKAGLVALTWGNASGIDRAAGVIAIKPSGVSYERMRPRDMVVVRLKDGAVASGTARPSSDTPTHLALYRAFPHVGGIVHTHSPSATAFAQARVPLPCLGTTHADHFFGTVPVTRALTKAEIAGEYEANTGLVIVECFAKKRLEADKIPAVLVAGHGPFTWGGSAGAALENSLVLEILAGMQLQTYRLNPRAQTLPVALLRKHFLRKHGKDAYYGQAAKSR